MLTLITAFTFGAALALVAARRIRKRAVQRAIELTRLGVPPAAQGPIE